MLCSQVKSLPPTAAHMHDPVLQSITCIGGRFRKPSKYCEMHLFFEDRSSCSFHCWHQLANTTFTCSYTGKGQGGSLCNNDSTDLLVRCRKSKGVTRFHDQIAGVLAIVQPCGVVDVKCILLNLYLFLVMTLPEVETLTDCITDCNCDLHPFLCNLSAKGVYFAKWLTRHISSFHVSHHREPCCMTQNNPQCKYYPKLAKFHDIRGANTECTEHSF